MKFLKIILSVFLLGMTSEELAAHPGHGLYNGYSPWHLITSEEHVIQLFTAGAVVLIIYLLYKLVKLRSTKK